MKYNFGWALEQLKAGKKVARQGWNGKGMYIYLDWYPESDDELSDYAEFITMRTANGVLQPGWLASQADMLSDDWNVVDGEQAIVDPIDTIVNWNKDAGLLNKPYDDFLESSFQIEEALEGFNLAKLTSILSPEDNYLSPKDLSRVIVKHVGEINIKDVDRLDKACDAIVYAVGSMAKLGLNQYDIKKALGIVMQANIAKLGCPKDEHGKLMKPDNFDELYAPEPKLQALLDSIK